MESRGQSLGKTQRRGKRLGDIIREDKRKVGCKERRGGGGYAKRKTAWVFKIVGRKAFRCSGKAEEPGAYRHRGQERLSISDPRPTRALRIKVTKLNR